MKDKFEIGFKILAVFCLFIAVFYFFFGMFFAGFIFDFGRFVAGDDSYVSSFVLESRIDISRSLVSSASPIYSFFLGGNVVGVGIMMILVSSIFFVVGLGLLKKKKFAVISVILFSLLEIFIAPFYLGKSGLSLVMFLLPYLATLFYFLFYFGLKKS